MLHLKTIEGPFLCFGVGFFVIYAIIYIPDIETEKHACWFGRMLVDGGGNLLETN